MFLRPTIVLHDTIERYSHFSLEIRPNVFHESTAAAAIPSHRSPLTGASDTASSCRRMQPARSAICRTVLH